MIDHYKEFWKVADRTEAWEKIITANKENIPQAIHDANHIMEGIPDGQAALEIGAGIGRLMSLISPHFRFVYGIDMSESMVELSKEYLKEFPNCKIVLGDGYKLPVLNSTYDFAYSFITFQHMPTAECVQSNIKEIYRALKPEGLCRIQTIKGLPYQGDYGKGGMHGYYYDNPELFIEQFRMTGFDYVTLELGKWHPLAMWVTARKPL